MSSIAQMTLVDRQLLNIVQSSFPLESEPFKTIASQLGIPEEEATQRLAALKKSVVRQISAIFDTRRLGYKTSLVAMRFPQKSLTKAAHRINQHPGVSHNYARKGYFNLWFTLAVPPNESLEETVDRLAKEAGAEAVRMLPTIRFFKIGVSFDMVGEKAASRDHHSSNGHEKEMRAKWNNVESLTDFEIRVVRELQEDLNLCSRPFAEMATRLGITEEELFSYAHAFQERGIMRRYSAVLHHRQAGFRANGMVVWKVPRERSEEVGRIMAAHLAVSHCYERPTFPDWPYSHFTMVHATSKKGCEQAAREISQQTGITEYQVLYSYREYKKTRVRYFA